MRFSIVLFISILLSASCFKQLEAQSLYRGNYLPMVQALVKQSERYIQAKKISHEEPVVVFHVHEVRSQQRFEFSRQIEDGVIQALLELQTFAPLERSRIDDAIKAEWEQGLRPIYSEDQKLKVGQLLKAKLLITGSYQHNQKLHQIIINLRLINLENGTIYASAESTISDGVLDCLTFKAPEDCAEQPSPEAVSFAKELATGVVKSPEMQVELTTGRGNQNLVFYQGDTVEFKYRMSHAGYFYIVGHVQKPGENHSYLLDMSPYVGQVQFTKEVSASQAGSWVSLGQFNISPPFGMESLQIIASRQPFPALPPVVGTSPEGLHLISNDARQGLNKTRAFLKAKKIPASEASLVMETRTKN